MYAIFALYALTGQLTEMPLSSTHTCSQEVADLQRTSTVYDNCLEDNEQSWLCCPLKPLPYNTKGSHR